MLQEVYPNIYKQEIPLPNNPLRAINSYIIVSEDRNLIVDTGFNRKECKEAFMKGIEELGIDFNKTDLFITHLHSDHCGLAAALNKEGARIYAGKIDGKMINAMTGIEYWENFNELKKEFDLEKDNISFDDHPGYKYCPKNPIDFIPLEEGDKIEIGDYTFEIIDIPGHTPGHIGLYERNKKIFFCGDHILDRITPNIAFWGYEQDILAVYFESLRKVYDYEIDYLFTAHRNIVTNHKKRIDELFEHHKNRLDEVREIIKDKKMTVRDTAANMHWDLRCSSWEEFPNPQKWFASGEAMSHLEHLYSIGEAERTNENGILYYKLKNER
ncbi:MBL fold metallo-hydrolase [Anaerosalibacter bizertensis]|uniref:MBL fold metallo-hydrolase n=1 Tax=Anaerosalibacter bizertensis TaxID=932217 RepID=A0A844FGH7_9FIRM|nr:MBL fold metallo-hydrolase [Anaerosalibacter bizertensis]MBV1818941.1 MBL fold metallo-hydrolase [Bacteroidales bacterium MSK.15.36]HHV27880.1 MBL fold metallo-hydrolase [Tissierellia bacterium]MBU5292621.1 MBL fold metallo-hydrolase [Anaerosalibacter bizertensis]MCB5559534.1 MBL fold metallo-hydrolase [Anaerosalibacter bizertensis]MCG4565716.1 MBL fold metallo-hydrolase [Anaerosalibacter bizertensis]